MKALRDHYDEIGAEHPAEFYPPDVLPETGRYLTALNRLSADRPLGIGMGGAVQGCIPFVAIERYAARNGFDDPYVFARFDRIIHAVDIVEVNRLNEKANKPT